MSTEEENTPSTMGCCCLCLGLRWVCKRCCPRKLRKLFKRRHNNVPSTTLDAIKELEESWESMESGELAQSGEESSEERGESGDSAKGSGESADSAEESGESADSAEESGDSTDSTEESSEHSGESTDSAEESSEQSGESTDSAEESSEQSGESTNSAEESSEQSGDSTDSAESSEQRGKSIDCAEKSSEQSDNSTDSAEESSEQSGESADSAEESGKSSEESAEQSSESGEQEESMRLSMGNSDLVQQERPTTESCRNFLTMMKSSFSFHSILGVGAFGKVMLASVPGKDSMVAVKMIRKKHSDPLDILRERRVLEVARESPFLLQGYAAFQSLTHAYLVMDYMAGGSIKDYLQKFGSMDENMTAFYAAEIICGIQFLHSRGIIHRDLKPGNVLLDSEGHIKIIDFGLAKEGIFGDAVSSRYCGTLPYMAPEIHRREEYGVAVDWWSFGVTLCRMLNGTFPFYNGCCRKTAMRAIKFDAPKYTKELGEQAVDILNQLLNKDPQQRMMVAGIIRQHPFFHGIDWDDIESRNTAPPYQPDQPSHCSLGNLQPFPSSSETTEDSSSSYNIQHLSDFSFVTPGWMF